MKRDAVKNNLNRLFASYQMHLVKVDARLASGEVSRAAAKEEEYNMVYAENALIELAAALRFRVDISYPYGKPRRIRAV